MIQISKPEVPIYACINLAGSKSISNRLLIIKHLLKLEIELENISTSQDTVLLQHALQQIEESNKATIDIHHAGTDLRFLTALLSTTSGEWTITGSERIRQRPVGELVGALRTLGANIQYLGEENYPPLKIKGKKLSGGIISIDASISSQFISALLLISPDLTSDLEIQLRGEIVSQPYVQMTIQILKEFGVTIRQTATGIFTAPLKKFAGERKKYKIESDWSSASYWYSICALSNGAQIELKYLNKNSIQGDKIVATIYKQLGVETEFRAESLLLINRKTEINKFEYDFTDCPDLAQTAAVTCLGLGLATKFTGLKTLKIKETDRILALKTELEKFGAMVAVDNSSLAFTTHHLLNKPSTFYIDTYDDHRMAMSFAPLALVYDSIEIRNPEVVSKSYIGFWEDLKSAGFSVNLRH